MILALGIFTWVSSLATAWAIVKVVPNPSKGLLYEIVGVAMLSGLAWRIATSPVSVNDVVELHLGFAHPAFFVSAVLTAVYGPVGFVRFLMFVCRSLQAKS